MPTTATYNTDDSLGPQQYATAIKQADPLGAAVGMGPSDFSSAAGLEPQASRAGCWRVSIAAEAGCYDKAQGKRHLRLF